MLSRRSRDEKEKDGRVIEGPTRETRDAVSPSILLSLFVSLSFRTVYGLDRPPRPAPFLSRTDEVGMIYARHAEASVTVCLMHWSSLDPLLRPSAPLRTILPPVVPRLLPPPSPVPYRAPSFYPRSNPLVVIDRGESGAFSWKPSTPTCT